MVAFTITPSRAAARLNSGVRVLMQDFSRRVGKSIARHFISMSCVRFFNQDNQEKLFDFSGFLIEARAVWFFVTAGHILRDIETALQQGCTFDAWRLHDQTSGEKFKGAAIPFHFDADEWLVVRDEEKGIDYAAFPLRAFYRAQLEAGGTMPIQKAAWGTNLDPHDHWVMCGIPSQTVEYDGETIVTARIVSLPLQEAAAPDSAGEKKLVQFYATLTDRGFVTDLDGMSGGPIFSFKTYGEDWGYTLIGVQSAWYPSAGVIAGCPIALLGAVLDDLFDGEPDARTAGAP